MEKNYRQQFYYTQNIDLRKQIRQYDLRLAQGESVPSQCNFIAAGPPLVGKTALLKTLQFALNGSLGWGITKKNLHSCMEIKKGARHRIEGTKELREINQKFGIQGIEISTEQKPSSRYKKAIEFVDGNIGQCIVQPTELQLRAKARVCLILVNIAMDLPVDQLAYLKYLRTDMLDRGVKVILVILGTFKRESQEWQHIQTRISALQSEFQIKRDDIFCMQTYSFNETLRQNGKIILKQSNFSSTKLQNNEELNFYALQLLQRIINESQKHCKVKNIKMKGWLCNWSS